MSRCGARPRTLDGLVEASLDDGQYSQGPQAD